MDARSDSRWYFRFVNGFYSIRSQAPRDDPQGGRLDRDISYIGISC